MVGPPPDTVQRVPGTPEAAFQHSRHWQDSDGYPPGCKVIIRLLLNLATQSIDVTIDPTISLQKQFAPKSICFGCGPANHHGLQLESFVCPPGSHPSSIGEHFEGQPIQTLLRLCATFEPRPYHVAFEGIVNGGIISVLLDCHLNWTGAWQLMQTSDASVPPCCVTAQYEVTFKAPTPIGSRLRLEAWVDQIQGRKAMVSGVLGPVSSEAEIARGFQNITATARGTFVAVKPGHPAYHRW